MTDPRAPEPHEGERPVPTGPTPSGELQVPPQRQPAPPPAPPGGPPPRPPYELVARPIPPYEPSSGQRFTSWWSRPTTILIVVLVLVLLLISTTVFATLAITGGGEPTAAGSPSASPSPTAAVETQTPEPPTAPTGSAGPSGPAPSGSAAPGGGVSLPPTPADAIGTAYQGGPHEESFPGPTKGYDFDGAKEVYVGGTFDAEDADAAVDRFGLVGLNGMGFAPSRAARPKLGDCASIARETWVLDIAVPQLKSGSTYCFTTTDGRYGYLTVNDARKNNSGQLTYLLFNFNVWEGPND